MKGQNRSSAVMQQRQEARDALDDFPTPMWATRAVCAELQKRGIDLARCTVREPCANRGYMVRPLFEYFGNVEASDVHDYGAGFAVEDYLFGPLPERVDWTFMNPPFRLAEQFLDRALATSGGVALFVRSAFLEGEERYRKTWSKNPPDLILQFSTRVVIHKGVMRQAGERYWDAGADNGKDKPKGKWRNASSATSYCWLIWMPKQIQMQPSFVHGTLFHWIGPRRPEFEREGDYAPLGDLAADTREDL
tara:strand:+ start:244 stop:990 length:747 start_codon:yes stop_codon:yes gene_type:complete